MHFKYLDFLFYLAGKTNVEEKGRGYQAPMLDDKKFSRWLTKLISVLFP